MGAYGILNKIDSPAGFFRIIGIIGINENIGIDEATIFPSCAGGYFQGEDSLSRYLRNYRILVNADRFRADPDSVEIRHDAAAER